MISNAVNALKDIHSYRRENLAFYKQLQGAYEYKAGL